MTVQEIIDKYKQGNRNVINELPRHIDGIIYKICGKYTGIDTIEELYQDAWVGVMKAIEKYDSTHKIKFTTYLYNMLNFHFMNLARDTRKYRNVYDEFNKPEQQFVSLDYGDEGMTAEPLIPSDYDIEHEVEIRHKFDVFNRYLENLSDRDRKIMQLRADEISYAEIGRIINCPKSTVERTAKVHQSNLQYIIERGGMIG